MNIDKYIEIQNEEFLEFGRNIDKIILVASKDILSLKNFYKEYNADVEQFVDSNSYVISRNDGNYELFILGSFKEYRKRFSKFLKKYYMIPEDYKLPSSLNVDHVFNKERAKNYYIRMILLDQKSNTEWGRAYEKTSSLLNKKSNYEPSNSNILLDYSLLLKILKFPSFKKGDIKNPKDISKIANESMKCLESLFGEAIMPDTVKTFYRAEINRLVTGQWRDPEYISPNVIHYTYGDLLDKKQDLQKSLVSLLRERKQPFADDPTVIEGSYLLKNTSDLMDAIEILDNIDNASDISWSLIIKDKTLETMIIRLHFDDESCKKYIISMRKI